VCPAGAIEPVEKEDKTSIQIGKAVWVKDNCVVLKNGHQCGNCARHCPAGAIFMVDYENKDKALQGKDSASQGKDTDKLKIPSVNESRCIGCGMCEYVCPSRPFSAIYVEGRQVHSNV
ncbi:MAG: 4Fe-4S dicluster domain-containing protein, partial [Bacteroidales bacterium]|nr:4Fe-4S dicluster domain-containing protein [Bacteroidales bacterium]